MDKTIQKKFWTMQNIILALFSVLFASFVIWQFQFADKSTKLNVEKDKITVSEVTEGTFDEFIIVQGVVL